MTPDNRQKFLNEGFEIKRRSAVGLKGPFSRLCEYLFDLLSLEASVVAVFESDASDRRLRALPLEEREETCGYILR